MHTFWEPFLILLQILIFCKYNFVASMTLFLCNCTHTITNQTLNFVCIKNNEGLPASCIHLNTCNCYMKAYNNLYAFILNSTDNYKNNK